MYIPDPIEQMDNMMDRYAVELEADDSGMNCAKCGLHTPYNHLHPASSHPVAPPICDDCLTKMEIA